MSKKKQVAVEFIKKWISDHGSADTINIEFARAFASHVGVKFVEQPKAGHRCDYLCSTLREMHEEGALSRTVKYDENDKSVWHYSYKLWGA